MSAEQVHSKAFSYRSVEFCKHVKFDKDKDRKDVRDRDNRTGTQGPPGQPVHKAHKAHKEFKVQLVLMEHKALQVSLTQNYVQQGQTWRMYMY